MLWRLVSLPLILGLLALLLLAFVTNLLGEHELEHREIVQALEVENTKLQVRERFNQFIDRVQRDSEHYRQIHRSIEKELLLRETVDLIALQTKYSEKLGHWIDLYLVNPDLVIVKTTFAPDLNLDFKQPFFLDAQESLEKARLSDEVIVGMPNQEITSGNYKLYTMSHLPDNRGYLEVGFIDPSIAQKFKSVQAEFESLAKVQAAELFLVFDHSFHVAPLTPVAVNYDPARDKERVLEEHKTRMETVAAHVREVMLSDKDLHQIDSPSQDSNLFLMKLAEVPLTDRFSYSYFAQVELTPNHLSWFAQNSAAFVGIMGTLTLLVLITYAIRIHGKLVQPMRMLSGAIRHGRQVDFSRLGRLPQELSTVITAYHEAIDKNKTLTEEFRHLAITDGLTGLYNRKALNELFARITSIAGRERRMIALIYLDLDRFKDYNDSFGHTQGDKALITLAEVLQSEFRRPTDSLIRMGGEEFAVLFETESTDLAKQKAESLRLALLDCQVTHPVNPPFGVLTLSAGLVTAVPEQVINLDQLLNAADISLYEAKQRGRNQVIHSSIAELSRPPGKA